MPKPVYMIVSESGSIDQKSNMVSIFKVIDSLTFRLRQPDAKTQEIGFVNMCIFSSWQADESDHGQEYEAEIVATIPGMDDPWEILKSKFRFEKKNHRFKAEVTGPMILTTPGTMVITNKIRRVGESEWLTQSYELTINVTDIVAAPAPSENN